MPTIYASLRVVKIVTARHSRVQPLRESCEAPRLLKGAFLHKVQQVCRALGTISTSKSQFRRPKVARADTPTVNVPRDAGHRRRRQKRSLITRDKIIAAAIEEFSQCGL